VTSNDLTREGDADELYIIKGVLGAEESAAQGLVSVP